MSIKIQLPSVSEVLTATPDSIDVHEQVLRSWIRTEIGRFRKMNLSGESIPNRETIVKVIVDRIAELAGSSLKNIINGTGIVLHTGFGRAPLGSSVLHSIADQIAGYSNLEYDLSSGHRGNRLAHVDTYLSLMIGAQKSVVVNNNAAAVLIALNTMAEGKDVIISRGQEVEIGGSFRIPDIIKKSNCTLIEVGTTNRTHLQDYQNAITKKTGLILWVHTSNYKIKGFTKDVPLEALVSLGKKHRIPVMADLGSGALVPLTDLGIAEELPVENVIKSGVDLVTFSGDKLLGGPQMGILAGKKKIIQAILNNPLYRTIRCDKIALAVFEKILRSYRKHSVSEANLALQLLRSKRSFLRSRADSILKKIKQPLIKNFRISVVETVVEAGSGSLPENQLNSIALQFQPIALSTNKLAKAFRSLPIPIAGYIEKNHFRIDLKAILPEQDEILISSINSLGSDLTS